MTNFYISDTHFGHAKIITLCKRPFANVNEMNEAMVRNWNSVVKEGDTVHFLGDFAWYGRGGLEYWKYKLNGEIIWYQGNHDPYKTGKNYAEIEDGSFKLVLCHYPIVSWNGMYKGWFHFYGHVHGQPLDFMPLDWRARAFDVGVECLGYTPRTAEQIIMKGNT